MKLFNRKDGTFSALNVSHDSSAASKGGDGDEDVPTNNNHPYNDDADDDDVPTLDLAASKTFQEEEEEEDEEEEPVVEVVTSANGESVILSDPPIPYDAQELSSSRRWSAFLQRFKTWNKQPENDNDDRVQGAEEPPTSSGHGHSRWSDMLKRTKTLPLSEEDVDDVDQDHQSAEHANANQQRIQEKPPLTVNDGGDGDQEDQAAERTRTSCCWSAVQRQRSRNKILPPFLRGWTKRERILLLIAAVNAIVMFALLGNNVALRRSNNSNSSINGPQFAAASGAETQCGGDDGSGGGVGGGGTGSPTVAPAATVVVTPGTVDATPPDDTVVGANATVDGTPVTTSNVTTGTTAAANDTVLPNGSGASQPETGDLCGCASCTDAIWKQLAGQFTCGDRIGYLQKEMPLRYPTQVHACRQIAFEFPCLCGGCDPGRCNLPTSAFALPAGWKPSTTTKYGESTTPAPTPVAKVTDPSLRQEDQTLYCFPSPELRTTSSELWGGMVLQVKEDANACGPGNNRFSTETVLIDPATDTLTILYKDNTASEVRVLLPESQRPFTYGTYSFSIQSVAVKTASGVVLSNVLPKELVLGLFSWDDTEVRILRSGPRARTKLAADGTEMIHSIDRLKPLPLSLSLFVFCRTTDRTKTTITKSILRSRAGIVRKTRICNSWCNRQAFRRCTVFLRDSRMRRTRKTSTSKADKCTRLPGLRGRLIGRRQRAMPPGTATTHSSSRQRKRSTGMFQTTSNACLMQAKTRKSVSISGTCSVRSNRLA